MSHQCNQDSTIERVLDNIEKVNDEIKEMNKTLVRNTDSLEEHMRRTVALENTLKPINTTFLGVSWAIGCLGIVGTILSIWKFFL